MSLKQEAEALAGGYVDVNTILPAWLPTTIGIGILENFTPLPKPSEKIRQGYQGQKKR